MQLFSQKIFKICYNYKTMSKVEKIRIFMEFIRTIIPLAVLVLQVIIFLKLI
jgi:hypothetical protein